MLMEVVERWLAELHRRVATPPGIDLPAETAATIVGGPMAAQPAAPTRPAAATPAVATGADDAVAQARRLGRLEAEALDRGHRDHEQRQREERLARLALGGGGAPVGGGAGDRVVASTAEVARLRAQVESLGAFHAAVVRSRSWRAMQALRRPFGRAW